MNLDHVVKAIQLQPELLQHPVVYELYRKASFSGGYTRAPSDQVHVRKSKVLEQVKAVAMAKRAPGESEQDTLWRVFKEQPEIYEAYREEMLGRS